MSSEAAAQNHPGGQLNLGAMFIFGRGVKQSHAEAAGCNTVQSCAKTSSHLGFSDNFIISENFQNFLRL